MLTVTPGSAIASATRPGRAVSPTRASVAYPADRKFEDAYPGISGGPGLIPAGNLCGLPASVASW